MKTAWALSFGAFFGLSLVNYAQTDDWPMFAHDPRRSNASSSVIRPPLKEVARLALPDGSLSSPGIGTHPPDFVVKSGKIYFGYSPVKRVGWSITYNQEIICLDANTAKPLWTRRLEGMGNEWFSFGFGGPLPAADLIARESLFVASQQGGFVAALDLVSGNEVWRSRDEQVNGGQWMALAGDILVVRSYGSIGGFSTRDGKLLWHRNVASGGYSSIPLFTDGGVFFTGRSTLNRADPATGEPLWTTPIPDNAVIQAATSSRLIVSGTDAWPPRHATVSAFDTVSGRRIWNSELTGVALMDLAASDTYVLAETINSFWDQTTVTCLETETGRKTWELTFVNTKPKSMVLTGNKYLYVLLSSTDPERVASLSAVDVANGKVAWQETFEISPYNYPYSQNVPLGSQTNYSRLKISDGKLLVLHSEKSGERYANTLHIYDGAPSNAVPRTLFLGRIFDADTQAALPGVAVEALQNGEIKAKVLTDAAGGYRMSGLSPGSYALRASGENYVVSAMSSINLSAKESITIDFPLRLARAVVQLAGNLEGPGPLTVQRDDVFWLETSTDGLSDRWKARVKKIPKSGGTSTTLTNIVIGSLGVGGTRMVSDTRSLYFSISSGGGAGIIYQMPLVGGGLFLLGGGNQPADLTIDDNFVYWAESSGTPTLTGIRRIVKQGGATTTLSDTVSDTGYKYAVALDAQNVYFGVLEGRFTDESWRTTLKRVGKNGGTSTVLAMVDSPNFESANPIGTIAVGDGKVYWGGRKGSIKVTPATGGPTTVLLEGMNQISNLVVDENRLFWIETDNAGSQWIKSLVVGSGKPEVVATGHFNNFILDADFIYATIGKAWLTNGVLLKIAKGSGAAGPVNAVITGLEEVIRTQPLQPTYGVPPAKDSVKKNLVVVTHGWQRPWKPVETTWVDTTTNTITAYLAERRLTDWQVHAYKWEKNAAMVSPRTALENARKEGVYLGRSIAKGEFGHVHLIAHSAGAALIQAASETIKATHFETVVHLTFLDPFVGFIGEERENYGKGANWADSYFSRDSETGSGSLLLTEGALAYGYNVDVTWLDTNRRKIQVLYSTPPGDVSQTCYETATSHGWPYLFYTGTIPPSTMLGSEGFGFPLSKEGGNWDAATNRYPVGKIVHRVLGSGGLLCTPVSPPAKLNREVPVDFSKLPGASVIINAPEKVRIRGTDFTLETGSPAWIAAALPITNRVNFVSFEAEFGTVGGGEGLLSVYWEKDIVGSIDERLASPGMWPYKFPIPDTVAGGEKMIGFRLDGFGAVKSSVTVTNFTLGFSGVREPFALSFGRPTGDRRRELVLTGPSGFNYIVETSTNLLDWTAMAILVNTNGVVRFGAETEGASRQFYRAIVR